MAEHLNLYIMGRWRPAGKGARHELRCPADGRLVAMGAEGSTEDMHAAIPAAREAFDTGPWPERERADVLRRTADLIDRDRKDFSRAEALDTGKRMIEAENDMDDVVACPRYYAGIGGTEAGRVVDTDKVDAISGPVYEPVGVCGLITPWNYPLLQAIWKVAPALLAGNTVVLTPSELTPSTAALLMRALEEAGLPAGVANLVLGAGPTAGAPLSEHPDVDMVSFTGGVPSGTRVMVVPHRRSSGSHWNRRQEPERCLRRRGLRDCGGLRPHRRVPAFRAGCRQAPGASSSSHCTIGSSTRLSRRAERIVLGGPFDPDAETGPLISAAHGTRSRPTCRGLAEGAVLVGARPDDPACETASSTCPRSWMAATRPCLWCTRNRSIRC